MNFKQLKKALRGKYIHFPLHYGKEKRVWGGMINTITPQGALDTNAYSATVELAKWCFFNLGFDIILELVKSGQHVLNGVVYIQLLNDIPNVGDKRLIILEDDYSKVRNMYYTIGKLPRYHGDCGKCALSWQRCKWECKKYRCNYLESYELNTKLLDYDTIHETY